MRVADSLQFDASMAKFKRPAREASLTEVMEQLAPQIADYRAKGHKWREIAAALSETLGERGKHLAINESNLRATWSQKDEFKEWRIRAATEQVAAPYVSDSVRRQFGDSLREALGLLERQRSAFEAERATWDRERAEIQASADQAVRALRERCAEMEGRLGSMEAQWNQMRYELIEERKKSAACERWRDYVGQIREKYLEVRSLQMKFQIASGLGQGDEASRLSSEEIPRLQGLLLEFLAKSQAPGFVP